jgi:RNase P subunit RPR2
MAEQQKTFKVLCVNCQKPFHVRFPLASREAEGTGDVVVTCLYCHENVMITIPREYIAEEALIKGIPSRH